MAPPSPSAARNMREKKARARKPQSVSSDSPASLLSLQAYVSNVFFGLFIQDDNEISELVFERNWSRKVQENDNGTPLNFDQFRKFILEERQAFSNRQVISQSSVVSPADQEGETGVVAHTTHFSANSQGKEVTGTIVAVLKIGLEKGLRKVETESFVFVLDS